jgi:hypothetical protein
MQFYQVQFRAVAFVLAEAIFRETRAEVAHNRVPRDFRDHARGRDAEAVAIAIDDRRLRQGERKNGQAVNEDVLRLRGKRGNCRPHRLVGSAQNVDHVDFYRIDHTDRPENGVVSDEIVVNLLAFFREELLRVVQPPVAKFLRKNHRGRHNRTGEGATARFVDAGNRRDTEGAKFAFMPEATTAIHDSAG